MTLVRVCLDFSMGLSRSLNSLNDAVVVVILIDVQTNHSSTETHCLNIPTDGTPSHADILIMTCT